MEAFSYQRYDPFLLDSDVLPTTPLEMLLLQQQVGEISNNSCSPFPYYSPEAILEVSATDASAYQSSSSLDTSLKAPSAESKMTLSSVVVEPHDEKVCKQQGSMEKKRKTGDGTCLSSGQSKESKSIRKQTKSNGKLKGKGDKKSKDDDTIARKAGEEPPAGYIHVRARRGQATDSHSLAERARREKIRVRMRMLQGLVPGCDKVIGKALMLDEIINYVRSLQNQVEFLSMKLASVNPMLCNFGVDIDDSMNEPGKMEIIPQQVPLVNQATHIQLQSFENDTNNYQLKDPSVSLLFNCQQPAAFSQFYDASGRTATTVSPSSRFHQYVLFSVEKEEPLIPLFVKEMLLWPWETPLYKIPRWNGFCPRCLAIGPCEGESPRKKSRQQ